jgi:hypothetical protein
MSPLMLALHFVEGGDGQGGQGGDTVPKAEAQRLQKERDQLRQGLRFLASQFGLDPDAFQVKPTGNADQPVAIEADGLDELLQTVAAARSASRGKAKWEDREAELNSAHQRQVKKVAEAKDLQIAARDAWVREHAVISPIRAACLAENAIDSDNGTFDDVVALLAPRIGVSADVDENGGRLKVKVSPLNEDGTPMLDGKGEPATVRQLVASFLNKRPHLKKPGFRPGPGVGGNGQSGQAASQPNNGNTQSGRLGRMFFGLPTN